MKNKVLRLAIVAVLVVAMVLSMAACNDPKPVDPTPVVTPTPTKTPDKTVAPSTPAPTKTPDVSTDEATLEAKYGITFPVAEDMKVSFKDTSKNLQVVGADGKKIPFGAKAPAYNDAFNAYKGVITVSAKVNALTAEGNKITVNDLTKADGTKLAETDWAYYLPTAAGTYTVVYTVKVAYPGDATFGGYKPAKVAETYSVTKVYEVGKKAITIESVSDAFAKEEKLKYPAADLKVGSLKEDQKKLVLEELKLDGAEKKFDLSIDIVSADLTAYGTYPLTLVCLDGKKQKVDLATLVAPDFEVTFKNGNRYVLTDAELAAAAAAQDDVDAAALGAKKEDIELGVATFTALSDASKTWFLQNATPKTVEGLDDAATNFLRHAAMNKNNMNLSRNGMVEEAFKLAKTWNDRLQNAEDGKKFVTYMLSLGTKPVVTDGVNFGTDYDFVVKQLKAAVTADATGSKAYITAALDLIDDYKVSVLADFALKFNDAVLAANFALTGKDFDQSNIDLLVKAVAAAQVKYDALVAGQEKLLIVDGTATDGANEILTAAKETVFDATLKLDSAADAPAAGAYSLKAYMTMLSTAAKEISARYAAYATLVDGLDAYTGDKVTGDVMAVILGYNFHDTDNDPATTNAKKVNASADTKSAAANVLFVTKTDTFVGGYVVFRTPMLFVENTTKSFKTLVDAYVALDAAIVSAQKDVITNLGSKIALAVDDKTLCDSFAADKFVFNAGTTGDGNLKDITRLEAMQAYIATNALAAVAATLTDPPFAALAKKELSVVIAAALKDPVAAVNDYIKGEDAFLFTVGNVTLAGSVLTVKFENLPKDLTKEAVVFVYKDGTNAVVSIDSTIANEIKVTFTSAPTWAAAADVLTVTYNGRTQTVKAA